MRCIPVHDLWHSYASRALAVGESLSMIGKLLGHIDMESTARYAHLSRETERAAAGRVGASIGADIAAHACAGGQASGEEEIGGPGRWRSFNTARSHVARWMR